MKPLALAALLFSLVGCAQECASPLSPAPSYGQYGARVGGTTAPDGTEIQIDLPGSQHLSNKTGLDGAGLCVFTAIDMGARWADVKQLIGFRDWMTRYAGGGYPEKVTKKITEICKARGVPEPDYVQIESKDLELLKHATKNGRLVCVTYSRSPTKRYGGASIAHMVNLPHADDKHFAVLDNNYPGPSKYEWMTPDEFVRYCNPRGYWAVILIPPPPPPPPRN